MDIREQTETVHALWQQGRRDEARALAERIADAAPDYFEPMSNCGKMACISADFAAGLYWYERALTLAPQDVVSLLGAGACLNALGRAEEGLEKFRQVQKIAPQNAESYCGAGQTLVQLGRLKEARASFEKAAALDPGNAHYLHMLADAGRFTTDDPRLPGLRKLAKDIDTLRQPAQVELHFALAKAADETGRTDEALEHWKAGNALARARLDYDESKMLGLLTSMSDAFTPDLMAAKAGCGYESETPVFVVGMPRSGTTLLEQIIASHPDAEGVGEKMYLFATIGGDMAGPDFPCHIADVPPAAFKRIGAMYASRLSADVPAASGSVRRIVNKLPANFMLCGLIALALPRAKILHIRRNPLDTCFSCYTHLFSRNIDYSYDLADLGRFYRAYEDLMAHWRTVLPPENFMEVRYEDLVENFEPEARRVLDFCGLGWNPACLEFHKTARTVHTLSSVQVRQPLYRSAIGRAERYRHGLAPLIAELTKKR